jgi:serine/threonine protein kinase
VPKVYEYIKSGHTFGIGRLAVSLVNYFSSTISLVQDLKPENLLLSERPCDDTPPVIKLTDFGIAKQLQGI